MIERNPSSNERENTEYVLFTRFVYSMARYDVDPYNV